MRLGRSRADVVCFIALAVGGGGCAIITQQAPRKNRAPGEAPVCSTGRGGVALDVFMATLLGAGALVALANDEPGVGLGVGAVGGIYAYSAVSGHRSASECEKALEDYQLEIAARRPQPPAPRGRQPARSAPAAVAGPPVLARPAGPSLEEAAPPEPEAPPPEEEVIEPEPAPPAAEPAPAAAPAPRDWSDFWMEVTR